MGKLDDRDRARIEVFHAESLAHGAANVGRLTRMLGLIVIGFGGLAGLASLLWKDHRYEVFFVVPFIIVVLWMSCIRVLAEMAMSSAYQRHYDTQLSRLLDGDGYTYGSWQQSAPRRGRDAVANVAIWGFLALVSLAGIGVSIWQSIVRTGWIGVGVSVIWVIAVALIVVAAARLGRLQKQVSSDLV